MEGRMKEFISILFVMVPLFSFWALLFAGILITIKKKYRYYKADIRVVRLTDKQRIEVSESIDTIRVKFLMKKWNILKEGWQNFNLSPEYGIVVVSYTKGVSAEDYASLGKPE